MTKFEVLVASDKQFQMFILNKVDRPTEFVSVAEDNDLEALKRKAEKLQLEKGQWVHIIDKFTFAIVWEGRVS
jgi:hypothetical protein